MDEDDLFEEEPVGDEEIGTPWLRALRWHGASVCRSSSMGTGVLVW